MGKGAQTRDRILRIALEAACLEGFGRAGLLPLAARAGLTKSGLYAHFRSKEALDLATVNHAAALFQATVVAPTRREPAGLERLEGLLVRWLGWPANAALPGRCPFFAAAFECAGAGRASRARVADLFREFEDTIAELARSAVRRGHLAGGAPAADLAHGIVGVCLAHHFAAEFMQEPAARRRAEAAFAALLAPWRRA